MSLKIQIFSFGGFYLNKICILRKYINTTVNVRFSLFGNICGSNHALLEAKINDPEICHFLIVLHDQCASLDYDYSYTYKLLT